MARLHLMCLLLFFALILGVSSGPSSSRQPIPGDAPQKGSPARFALGGNASEIPAEFVHGVVFLPVRVNDSQPSSFLLSGATDSSIDLDRANQLELKILPSDQDPSWPSEWMLRDVNLELPGLVVPMNSLHLVTRNDFSAAMGRPFQGSLAADFLSRVILEIDYARATVRVYDPKIFQYAGKGRSLPLKFSDGALAVSARCHVPGQKVMERNFSVEPSLDASVQLGVNAGEGHGSLTPRFKTIGVLKPQISSAPVRLGRIKGLQLGPYVIEEPIAAFIAERRGHADSISTAGAIGTGLLRRFTVTFDLPHERLILEPNSHFTEYDEDDMSGLALEAKGPGLKTFEVMDVLAGSPAATAGILKGDAIAGINEEAAADLTLPEVRELFRQIGHKYRLLIDRHGQTLEIQIQMRRLI